MSAAGVKSKGLWRVMCVGILLLVCVALSACGFEIVPVTGPTEPPVAPEDNPITVKITNPGIERAVARVVETDETDSLDQNILTLSSCSQVQHISVWALGYYIYTFQCNGNSPFEYQVTLEPVNGIDNPNYTWTDADLRTDTTRNCARCHSGSSPNLNEYSEWTKDNHSRAVTNPLFWTMYTGMDSNRNPGPQTQWGISGNGQRIRLAPDPRLPDYGPGYHLDYPNDNGNCVYCHVPAGLPGTLQGMSLTTLINSSPGVHINVATEGVTCDVCHKVIDVMLGNDGLPHVDRPGVLSMSFVRPSAPDPFFVGPKPFELMPPAGVKTTCSPIFSESEFCAACHYGKFGDVVVYNSYGEWLESPYSEKVINSQENANYRSCQDCHMLSPEQVAGTLPSQRDACSETNVDFQNFNHNMMKNGPDPDNPAREIPLLVKGAAEIRIDEARIEAGLIKFKVMVTNTRAGHKFPTDSPLRHLILLVQAMVQDTPLPQTSGPTIQRWGAPDYAGYAGEIYANLLKDKDTNEIPTFAHWNTTELGPDTRLVPGQPVQNEYSFVAPSNGSAVITVKLVYRNAFIEVANLKKITPMDMIVTAMECTSLPTQPERFECRVIE